MGKNNKECKWCAAGECWSHGQIEKPAGVAKKEKKVASGGKGGKAAGGKGGKAAGGKGGFKGVGGKGADAGCWVWQPAAPVWDPYAGMAKGWSPHGAMGGKGFGKVQQTIQKQTTQANQESPTSGICSGVQLLLGRSSTKEDVVYEISEVDGKHVAVLTIPDIPGDKHEFKGQPAASKKEAKDNAAKKALKLLAQQIKVARKAKDEVTAEKQKVKMEMLKEKRAIKKAEADAAAPALK